MSSRRRFLSTGLKAAGGFIACRAEARSAQAGQAATRPDIPYGTTTGDVTRDRAIVWSRTDRPARMLVEWSTTESMQNARRVPRPPGLFRALSASRAAWKVIASDLPIGLVVRDGPATFEGIANAEAGNPLGRELEIADLLRYIRQERIRNVVWITGDVHYAAAHHYDPQRAQFKDFGPFWEFVAGPLHAGTYGPNELDATFGPEVRFASVKPGAPANRPPSDGFQFFGLTRIAAATKVMTVELRNLAGETIYSVDLDPT
jgi:phosphodiesterase/alkaline phosphatase D-like protein